MKRELGIARCGLACCLCSENDHCGGCNSGDCPGTGFCENRPCSMDKGIGHCYECNEECKKGMRKLESFIIVRGLLAIMMILMMWKNL